MADTIILDPSEVAAGRTELNITAFVRAEGVDWGDGAIEAAMADRERGSAPIDFRYPNRQIVLPLTIRAQPGVSYLATRQNLQKKIARFQHEGGWIRRTTNAGTLFADVVNGSLRFGGSWMQARSLAAVDIEAELRLECIPDWYGPEEVLPDHTDTVNGDLIWTETNIKGDYPGRVRVVVDEDQGQAQSALLWGVRCRHYSSSTTAALRYFGSQLTPLDTATVTSGSVLHPGISTAWTPVASTDQAGGVALTHTGTYQVWMRGGLSTLNSAVRFRLVWDVGDFALPTENEPALLEDTGNTYIRNLGQIRLDRAPPGAHRWRGVIQAAGAVGGESVFVDRLWLQPMDEGGGVLRAPAKTDAGMNAFTARDEFNQTAGVLAGKALPAGGSWAGAGDTDDFVVEATGHTAQRIAGGDSSTGNGRFALAGTTNYAATVVQVDFKRATYGQGINNWTGVIARYASTSTWLFAGLAGNAHQPFVEGYVGGSPVVSNAAAATSPEAGRWYTVRLMVDAAGRYLLWIFPAGGTPGNPVVSGLATQLATAGTLASGRNGFYDSRITPISGAAGPLDVRNFNNFLAWTPQQDAVLFPSQSAELRTEGMFREDPTGAAYGPVSHVVGDLPRIPPSGAEGRTVQFFLKQSRGDLDTLPDVGVDDISARISYRPSYLLTS